MRKLKLIFLLFIVILITGCGILPETLDETKIIVVANNRWISMFGKKSIEVGGKAVLRNLDNGRIYRHNSRKKGFTYFYKLPPGKYRYESVVYGSYLSNMRIKYKVGEKSEPFEIKNSGIYFISGINVIDKQIRFYVEMPKEKQIQEDMEHVKKYLIEKTAINQHSKIQFIDVFPKVKKELIEN